MKTLYALTKTLSNGSQSRESISVIDKHRNLPGNKKDLQDRWTEHFQEVLNREPPQNLKSMSTKGPGSLQNRRISGVSAIHESAREALSQNYPPVVTPLFMLFQPFAWRTVCADWLLYITWSSNVLFSQDVTRSRTVI